MSAVDYDEILNRSWDEVPEEQLLPGGSWLLEGTNAAFIKPKQEGQSLKVLFSYKAKQPVAVDEDALEALPEGYDVGITQLNATFYIENAADLSKVRKHLATHGIEVDGPIMDENGKFAANKAFRGAEVVAELGQRNYENAAGETIWQNTVSKFQKAE